MPVATISLFDTIKDSGGTPQANVTVSLSFGFNAATDADGLILPSVRTATTDGTGKWTIAQVIPTDLISPSNTVYLVETPFRTYEVAPQSGNGASQQSTAANVIVNNPLALAPYTGLIGGAVTFTGLLTAQAGEVISGGAGATLNASGDLAVRSLTASSGSGPYTPSSAAGTIENVYYAPPPNNVDDTTALQAVLTAVRLIGGGMVILQPGTYLVSIGTRTLRTGTTFCCLVIGANTLLVGAGRDATVIKLIANQQGNQTRGASTYMIQNWGYSDPAANGLDPNITLEDFTVDGNGANQTDTNSGISIIGRFTHYHRLKLTNVRGTSVAGGLAETFAIQAQQCADVVFDDVLVMQTAGQMSDGITVGPGVTNAMIVNCKAFGLTNGFGFNLGVHTGQLVAINCHAYLCLEGFHLESTYVDVASGSVLLAHCVAGGRAALNAPGHFSTFPYATGALLGNVNYGFQMAGPLQNISMVACIAAYNGLEGVIWRGVNSSQIIGGKYYGNGRNGIHFTSTNTYGCGRNQVEAAQIYANNTTGQVTAAGSGVYIDAASGVVSGNNVVEALQVYNDSIATPGGAPTLTDGGAAGTNLLAQAYTVGYVWLNAEAQETAISPTAIVTPASPGNKIHVAAIAAPAGAVQARFYVTAAASGLLGPLIVSNDTIDVISGTMPASDFLGAPTQTKSAGANATSPQTYGIAQDAGNQSQGNLYVNNNCTGNATANTLNIANPITQMDGAGTYNLTAVQATVFSLTFTIKSDVTSWFDISATGIVAWDAGTGNGNVGDECDLIIVLDSVSTYFAQVKCMVAATGWASLATGGIVSLTAGAHTITLQSYNLAGARGQLRGCHLQARLVPNLQ